MKSRTRKKTAKLLTLCVTCAIAALTATTSLSVFAGTLGGKYYPDVTSLEEVLELAGDVNLKVAEEGNVLLKNDGTLPLTGNEYVSVFGVSSSMLVGANANTNSVGNAAGVSDRGPIYDSLANAGFKVNGILADFYAAGNGANDIGNETTDFGSAISSSINMYNDVGVIVFSRSAGEGADAATVTSEKEDNKYGGTDQGWKHQDLFTGKYAEKVADREHDAESQDEYKHYLQLTDSEEELIKVVESKCKKVVVVLNTANAMEMYNLREDDKINGILLMGRPGETGHIAVGEILKGTVNPSGKLVDEWNTDFTADPTWANYGYGDQVGSKNMYYYSDGSSKNDIAWGTHQQEGYYGVDYEEDIYLGYSYWETYYHEYYQSLVSGGDADAAEKADAWWKKNVAFPFGYGLSYTSFSFDIDESAIFATGGAGNATKVTGSLVELMTEANLASSEGSPAKVKTLNIPVKVTNTGDVAGKEVVEIYVTAPYGDGAKLEKSFVTLAGYAKTEIIRAGESRTINVKINVQDFASFDYNDANGNKGEAYNGTGYELDKGDYIIRAMNTSHFDVATEVADPTDAYDEVKFSLANIVNLELDDFSDERAEALFSESYGESGIQASTDEEHYLVYNSLRNAEMSADDESAEKLVSRTNILNYQPVAPTMGDLTLKDVVIDNWEYWNDFDETVMSDQEGDGWYKTATDIDADWTQGTGVVGEDGQYPITITDMMGKALYGADGNFTDAWNEFMNQLTVDEMKYLVERQNSLWTTSEMKTIGKRSSDQADSYNDVRTAGGIFLWTDSPTLAATWNIELANKVGMVRGDIELMKGWSGYGGKEMDTHRSPFSGRNAEYLSQDGIQGGYIAAAFTSGMESKGVTCYIKHFALNDMETCRDGMCNNVWVSEQAARQIYFKVFQMAMQEGGSSSAMTGFARFCGVPVSSNNRMLESMVMDEWGWSGFYITDGYSGVSKCTSMQSMMRGYCIPLPLGSSVPTILGEWDAEKNCVTVDGEASPTQYYYLRNCAARILYADAKSNDVLNGFVGASLSAADADALTFTQGSEINKSLGLSAATVGNSTAVYTLKDGSLPSGVTFSTSDGTISGTPKEAGTFTFTVDCVIDNWINSSLNSGLSKTYTLTVNSAFKLAEGSDSLDSAAVGEDFYARITSDSIVAPDGGSIKYSVVDGDLTGYGLTLSEDGKIEGTPTKGGTVDFTVKISVSSASSGGGGFPDGGFPDGGFPGGGGGGSSSTDYTYSATIVIAGDPIDPDPGKTLTEAEIRQLIDDAIAKIDTGSLTQAEIQKLIDDSIAKIGSSSLTKEQVQSLIDEALKAKESSGCNGSLATSLALIGGLGVMAATVAVVTAVRKRKTNTK